MSLSHMLQICCWAAPIALASFLFFTVQPLLAKSLLPIFGGSASVWLVSLMFFQVQLFLGYSYAYGVSWIQSHKIQILTHGIFLLLTLLWIPLTLYFDPSLLSDHPPSLLLLSVLTMSIAVPGIALSATSPLYQYWWSDSHSVKGAYKFYSVSNGASLLGLFLYPSFIERVFGLKEQMALWSLCYLVYVVTCIVPLILFIRNTANAKEETFNISKKDLNAFQISKWITLSFGGTVLLLSFSRHITTDIAPFPLLWIIPLALYLITFIIAFAYEHFHRSALIRALCYGSLILWPLTALDWFDLSLWQELAISFTALFAFCSFLHGELSSSKPEREQLTLFYLLISLGSCLGGAFVTLVAPLVFNDYYEEIIGLALVIFVLANDFKNSSTLNRSTPAFILYVVLFFTTLIAAELFGHKNQSKVYAKRNFYGQLKIIDKYRKDESTLRSLVHGTIEHGAQLMTESGKSDPTPISYYSTGSGVGKLLDSYERSISVLAIGLGAGAISSYMKEGDSLSYYEINPAVVEVANEYFSYLKRSSIEERITIADGRLGLEDLLRRDGSANADILVVDAFNSDSIPTHLLTAEAFTLYWKHLKPDRVIAVLFDSDNSDLLPVLNSQAKAKNKEILYHLSEEDTEKGTLEVEWALITSNEKIIHDQRFQNKDMQIKDIEHLWTDDYSDLWSTLRW